jgi:hypothetical protein
MIRLLALAFQVVAQPLIVAQPVETPSITGAMHYLPLVNFVIIIFMFFTCLYLIMNDRRRDVGRDEGATKREQNIAKLQANETAYQQNIAMLLEKEALQDERLSKMLERLQDFGVTNQELAASLGKVLEVKALIETLHGVIRQLREDHDAPGISGPQGTESAESQSGSGSGSGSGCGEDGEREPGGTDAAIPGDIGSRRGGDKGDREALGAVQRAESDHLV